MTRYTYCLRQPGARCRKVWGIDSWSAYQSIEDRYGKGSISLFWPDWPEAVK